jgi:ribosome recycling factor
MSPESDISPEDVLLEVEEKFEKTLSVLKQEFRGMRTGRAHPGLIENVRVDYYGTLTPLKQLANIGVPEPTLLVVKPFDPGSVGAIEKAILKSDVGITPMNDGKIIRLVIPPLSEERRRQLVGRAKETAEEAKISMRNVRRDANRRADAMEKAKEISEDEAKDMKDEIQDLLKDYEKKVEEALEQKTNDLMEI